MCLFIHFAHLLYICEHTLSIIFRSQALEHFSCSAVYYVDFTVETLIIKVYLDSKSNLYYILDTESQVINPIFLQTYFRVCINYHYYLKKK